MLSIVDNTEFTRSNAYNKGRYCGFDDSPECPYARGTPEHRDWWDGYCDVNNYELIDWGFDG